MSVAAGVAFVSAAVMVSAFGSLNGSMMVGPRIFYAMAEDRLFRAVLSGGDFELVVEHDPIPFPILALGDARLIPFLKTFEGENRIELDEESEKPWDESCRYLVIVL